MGDRFYEQQKEGKRKVLDSNNKPKRKLKADWIKEIEQKLDVNLEGLTKTTLDTLKTLSEAINAKTI